MTSTFSMAILVWAGALVLAGVTFGLVYFAALRRTVTLLATQRGCFGPATLTLGRIAAIVLFLGFAARLGALPMLAAFLGFLMARAFALHTARRAG
jgi:N-ATPase, AtpR subunit